jgi:hypothetical protein
MIYLTKLSFRRVEQTWNAWNKRRSLTPTSRKFQSGYLLTISYKYDTMDEVHLGLQRKLFVL